MPIFTVPVVQQIQASGAGSSTGPNIPNVSKGVIWSDQFARTTLNPTNAVALYVATNGSTGTASILSGGSLSLQTAATLNDTEEVTATEIGFKRIVGVPSFDAKNQILFNFLFTAPSTVTSHQFYIGINLLNTALAALPTTAGHMGLYLDTSVSNNFKLTSANGSTQSTTDSGEAISGGVTYRLEILWDGDASATINFYKGSANTTNADTLVKSQTVSALAANRGITAYFAHFFLKTLTAGARNLQVQSWGFQVS